MTPTSPTHHHTSTDTTTDPSTTSTTTTDTTEHYSRSTNTSPERKTKATRSNDSHRCITIRGCGPAFGRPGPTRAGATQAVDLRKIITGWSGC